MISLIKLKSYQLFTFKPWILKKLLLFAHDMKTNARSPSELQSSFNLAVNPNVQTEKDTEKKNFWSLRNRKREKFKNLTFKHFFPTLLNFFGSFLFSVRDSFRLRVNLNLKKCLKIFFESLSKLDIKYSAFHRKKLTHSLLINLFIYSISI